MADNGKTDPATDGLGFKLADPAVLGRSMADIAERSQRLVTDWLNRQSHEAPEFDPMNVGHAFMEMTAQLMNDPAKLMQAQIGFWQDYMTLWQNTTRRILGMDGKAEPVIQADPKDRRFKDDAWKENEVFDFIKQSYLLSARYVQDVVSHVDGLDAKTAQKVDFYARQFVDAMSPSNFLLTNPEVLRQTAETGGENLLRGLNNLLVRPRARPRQAHHQDDRHGRVPARREHRRLARQGRVPERADAAHPVFADHRDRAEAAAADRAALDQQVLHPRPAAEEQLRALGGEPGPHRVHGQLGQPRRASRRDAASTIT